MHAHTYLVAQARSPSAHFQEGLTSRLSPVRYKHVVCRYIGFEVFYVRVLHPTRSPYRTIKVPPTWVSSSIRLEKSKSIPDGSNEVESKRANGQEAGRCTRFLDNVEEGAVYWMLGNKRAPRRQLARAPNRSIPCHYALTSWSGHMHSGTPSIFEQTSGKKVFVRSPPPNAAVLRDLVVFFISKSHVRWCQGLSARRRSEGGTRIHLFPEGRTHH